MMKPILNMLGGLFVLVAWTACVEDNTQYDLKDLNKVTIEDLEDKYSVMLYSKLQITPTIKTSHNDDSKLSYAWYAYTKTSSIEADTLSYERNLDVVVDPSMLIPGEDYTLVLRVTDDETGVYYQDDMKLEVTTQFSKGTLFLCEENGEAELNFLQDNKEGTFLEGIYKGANKEVVGRNPLRIISVNPSAYAPFLKQEYILCNDENGGMIASPLSFEKVSPLRDAFEMAPSVDILNPQYYFKGGMIEYLIVDGALHKRATNMKAMNWEPALVLMDTPADYKLEPDVIYPTGTPVFFDNAHKRLVLHPAYNKGYIMPYTKSATDPQIFDPDNLGEDMELQCWGASTEVRGGAWMLLKNVKDNTFWMYKFVAVMEFSSVSKIEVTDVIAPNLKNAIAFAVNQDMKDLFVYATSDGIYSFAVDQLKASTSTQLEVLQQDMKAEQMEVTGMEFLNITVADPTPEEPNATRISSQVRAYVRDLSLGEKQGGAVFYEVNTTGGVHFEQLFKKTGFCDKVIDIDEKYN